MPKDCAEFSDGKLLTSILEGGAKRPESAFAMNDETTDEEELERFTETGVIPEVSTGSGCGLT